MTIYIIFLCYITVVYVTNVCTVVHDDFTRLWSQLNKYQLACDIVYQHWKIIILSTNLNVDLMHVT